MSKRYEQTVEALVELFNEEHGGCDQLTCDMSQCLAHGYSLWALQLFAWCGVASDEFTSLFETLPKRFKRDAELERCDFLASVAHDECPHCNAVVWHDGTVGGYRPGDSIHCDSCARSFTRTETESETAI